MATLEQHQPKIDDPVTTPSRQQTGERQRASARETIVHLGDASSVLIAALQHVQEPVLVMGEEGVIVFANESCERFCGRPPGGLTGLALRNLLGNEAALEVLRRADSTRSGTTEASPFLVDATLLTGGPEHRRCQLRVTPTTGTAGHQRHVVVSLSEPPALTARTQAGTINARQAFSVAARLAGELAHDLNNELSVLLNYSFVLIRKVEPESPLREHLEEIKQAAWRASRLSQGLFRFGRKHNADGEEVNLDEALLRMAPLLETALLDHRALDVRIEHRPARLHAPLGRIEQLLMRAAVEGRELPASLGPLRISLAEVRMEGRSLAELRVGPVPAVASEPESHRGREGVVTDKIQHALERFGATVTSRALGDDAIEITVRIPT